MVTGGCGFIGSHLVSRLVREGAARVIVVDGLRCGDEQRVREAGPNVELVRHELGHGPDEELRRALSGVELVFHLAAEKHNASIDDPLRVYRSNVVGTHLLLEAAADAGVKKVVFSSSLYAYGRDRGAPFDESETPHPITPYGISKLAGEHLVSAWRTRFEREASILRYMFVYGPRQLAGLGYKSVIVRTFERLAAGLPPILHGDGSQALDYVYVDDVVTATLLAMERDAGDGPLNVGSGVGTTIRELVTRMARVAGDTAEPELAPADATAGSTRVARVERIARALGWRATTPLDVGLAAVWRDSKK